MEDSVGSAATVDAKDKLIKSLTTFLQLYNQHEAVLHQASERFTQEAAHVRKRLVDSDNVVLEALSFSGGCIGAVSGAVTGGVLGALGAATFTGVCEDIRAVDAFAGFLGGAFGGTIGGAFSGAVGGFVNTLTKSTRNPVYYVLSEVLWFSTGFVSGGVMGVIIGGSNGAAGGAMGAGFGALTATMVADDLIRGAADYFETNKTQKAGEEFSGSVALLVKELKTIQTLCNHMAPSDVMMSVAEQTATTLAAAQKMEEGVRKSQAAANLPQFPSCVEEAAARCKKMLEGLQTTRAGVEKLLLSLGAGRS